MALWNSRFSNSGARARPRVIEPAPASVGVQVYGLLISHGFAFDEAAELASQTAKTYRTSTQTIFLFPGGLQIEIVAARARKL